ncbi:MAG: NADH-quinone oxidoreductase subunit H, partial [Candidatus Sumerlaeaceae bacterium]|nr:NADH-quinone oxidoreductase subunit H [Candidatus Sumerlaeaceae bacterium]
MTKELITHYPNHAGDFAEALRQLFSTPHQVGGLTVWPGVAVSHGVAAFLAILIGFAIILAFVSISVMILVYLERKVAGHIQSRLGPMRVGWHGILQSIADGIKLLTKEDIIPAQAHKLLFSFAPVLVLVGAIVPFVAVPFAEKLVVANMDLGLFFVLSFASLEVIGVVMAGWAPNSKWSLYGGMRLAAQMMSYEIPLGISALVAVVLSGSLNLSEITDQQRVLPWVLVSP